MLNQLFAQIDRFGRIYGIDIRYIIRNEFWVYFRQGTVLLTGLGISVAFAHLVSETVFGQYNLVLAILGTVSVIAIPGMNPSIARSIAMGLDSGYRQATKIKFIWSLIGIPVLLGVGAYYYYFNNSSVGLALMIASVFFPLLYSTNIWESLLIGKKRFDLISLFGIMQTVIHSTALLLVILLNPSSILSIILTYLVVNSTISLVFYYKSLRYIDMTNQTADAETVKYGYFLTGINIVTMIAAQADKIIVGTLLGPIELAIYSFATMIPFRLKDLFKLFWHPFAPKISAQGIQLGDVVQRLRSLAFPLITLTAVIALVYWLFVDDIIVVLFSEKYIESGLYAQLLLFWLLLSLPESFLGTFIVAKKEKTPIFWSNYVVSFLGIPILGILIFFWGITGAVLALTVNKMLRIIVIIVSMFIK